MNFKFKYTDKIVGVFVLVSFFLCIGAIFLIIYNQKYFTKKYYFKTQFKNADGLKINQDIYFKGFKIGRVKKIKLNKDNFVDVDFFVYAEYIDKIKENSVINKASNPLTGSKIMFTPNIYNIRIADEYSFIPSLDTVAGEFLLAIGEVEKKADAISNIINNIEMILAAMNSDHNEEDNSIARILVNTADIIESVKGELDDIDIILSNVKQMSHKMKDPDGLVQRLIDPDGTMMFNSIRDSLDTLSKTMEELYEFSQFMNSQSKTVETVLIDGKSAIKDAKDIIESLKNNPLIKGNLEEEQEQEIIRESIRDRDF